LIFGTLQEHKFKDAIRYYEPAIKKQADAILDVTAIVLANLCVSYIMTSQNEDAEELMRQIEKEEERCAYQDPVKIPISQQTQPTIVTLSPSSDLCWVLGQFRPSVFDFFRKSSATICVSSTSSLAPCTSLYALSMLSLCSLCYFYALSMLLRIYL
jgi:hypothetical protein